MKEAINAHFEKILEMGILVFIFVFGTAMLAKYGTADEMARWIEGGTVIAVIAQGLRGRSDPANTKANPPADTKEGQ